MDTVTRPQFPLQPPHRETRNCSTLDNKGQGVTVALFPEGKWKYQYQYQISFCLHCGNYINLIEYNDPTLTHDRNYFTESVLCKCVSHHSDFSVFSEVHPAET